MRSAVTDDQLMIHELINLVSAYELQMALLEKTVRNKENPLEVTELCDKLNIRF
jgi:hypothetical protein